MSKISKYNSWVNSMSKTGFVMLIAITSILETIALEILPSIIDNNYKNVVLKSVVILIIVSILNFAVHLSLWKKQHENN